MFNFKRMIYLCAVGFAADMLLTVSGVKAAPQAPPSDVQLFHKGLHHDNNTGLEFDLFVLDDSIAPDEAFKMLQDAHDGDDDDVAKRAKTPDWYNCRYLGGNIQKFGCNTAHALGNFVSNTGAAATGGYINSLLQTAFGGGDNRSPRSVCLANGKDKICVSWATFSAANLKPGEASDITKYSEDCAMSGGSSKFQTVLDDGGIMFICVSDRPDGCSKDTGVC